jgi:GNAT superfamily N-acetyltransferase
VTWDTREIRVRPADVCGHHLGMGTAVELTDDPAYALARADEFLATRPVEHNLVLTILHDRVEHPEPGRYWLVVDDGAIVGVALQSPTTYFATMTAMTRVHVAPLAESVARTAPALPGVNAEAGTAAAFAGHWSEILGIPAAPVLGQRLYELGKLRSPDGIPGLPRVATVDDHDLALAWLHAFHDDVGQPPQLDPAVQLRDRMADDRVWLWDDDGPRAMVSFTRTVGGISRIGPVYTPPEHRRHGYAAACTAAVSQHVLDHHADGCVLHTDLANPTSNAIYRRLGYEAVAEILRYQFGS